MSENRPPLPATTGGLAASIVGEDFSISEAVGGPRGVIESLLPGVVFVAAFIITGKLWWTVGLSAAVSVVFVLARLAQRTPVTQALAGLLGVGIGVVWAARSGQAEDYYAWGLLTNLAYGAVLLLSLLVRQPLAAWAVRFLWSLPPQWKKAPEYGLLYRRCVIVTWAWVAVFAIRLSVQAPLYYAHAVAALGIAKLLLGLPLFALVAWLTWVLLRNLRPQQEEVTEEESSEDQSLEP